MLATTEPSWSRWPGKRTTRWGAKNLQLWRIAATSTASRCWRAREPAFRRAFQKRLWCKRFEVEPSRRREVALDHAARTAFQILGAVLRLVPSLPSLN